MSASGFLSADEALAYFDGLVEAPAAPRIYGVAELLRRLSNQLASQFSSITVAGEIHSITRSAAGHLYFDLKDEREEAHVNCALFRGQAARLGFAPRQGDKVQVVGELNVYAPRGQLNFVVRTMRKAGEGDLFARFAALKEKLLAEGLFSEALKKPLPKYPQTIGIVTSPQAAALRDVVRTIRGTGVGVRLILFPASVQGDEAEGELLAALERAEASHLCDVLLLVRGGGSLADLWTFNSEKLARTLRTLSVPVVTGVGHETDTTIADWAADVRTATPTAAAARVMSEWLLAKTTVPQVQRRLQGLMTGRIGLEELRLQRALVYERLFERRMEGWMRRVDAAASEIQRLPQKVLSDETRRFEALSRRFMAVAPSVDPARARVSEACRRLSENVRSRLAQKERTVQTLVLSMAKNAPDTAGVRAKVSGQEALIARLWRGDVALRREKLAALVKRLKALAPQAVLSRGYALALDEKGRVLRRADEVNPGDKVTLRLASGTLGTRVETRQAASKG